MQKHTNAAVQPQTPWVGMLGGAAASAHSQHPQEAHCRAAVSMHPPSTSSVMMYVTQMWQAARQAAWADTRGSGARELSRGAFDWGGGGRAAACGALRQKSEKTREHSMAQQGSRMASEAKASARGPCESCIGKKRDERGTDGVDVQAALCF